MNDKRVLQSEDIEQLIASITDEFMDRLAAGESPSIDEYANRYPQAATLLRQVLPALQVLQSSDDVADAGSESSMLSARLGGQLGDFRILREIGRGGMGVVYEAKELSLGRQVALKVLPLAAALDERQLQRFKNEAHAAATLHHGNIVPVYSVGCERGVHYYAMQYIEGHTLGTLIDELRQLEGLDAPKAAPVSASARRLASGDFVQQAADDPNRTVVPDSADDPARTEPAKVSTQAFAALSTQHSSQSIGFLRTVADLGRQAAEALEHAHECGVIHRDIKPGNILVDLQGQLWITDFGLAQLQSDSGLTLTGDLIGTIRYMSPEQAQARRVGIDHRTDVYSLGVTLYELLTLEPAFPATDRRELLNDVLTTEPRPPRQVNRTIPADLETIVLKAIAKRPAERYATAQEMADDLRRFLNDEPIRARRPTIAQRLNKWSRRHRGVVWTAVSLLIMLTIGSTLAAIQINTARSEAEKQAATANQVTQFLVDIIKGSDSDEQMGFEFGTGRQGDELTAREIISRGAQRVQSDLEDQPEVQLMLMDTIGHISRGLGFLQEAEPLLSETLERRRELYGDEHLEVALSLDHLAWLRHDEARFAEGEELHREALEIRRRLLGNNHPLVAESLYNLGFLIGRQFRDAEAEEYLQESLEIRQRVLGEDHPAVGASASGLAWSQLRQRKVESGLQHLADATEIFSRHRNGQNVGMVFCRYLDALVKQETGDHEAAETAFYETIELARSVFGEGHPMVAQLLEEQSIAFERVEDGERSVESRRRSTEATIARLGEDHPLSLRRMFRLAKLLHWDHPNPTNADVEEADRLYRRVMAIYEEKLKESPNDLETKRALSETLRYRAVALSRLGQRDEGIQWCQRGAELASELYELDPQRFGHTYVHTTRILGFHLSSARRFPEAIQAMESAEAAIENHLEKKFAGRLHSGVPTDREFLEEHRRTLTEMKVKYMAMLGAAGKRDELEVVVREYIQDQRSPGSNVDDNAVPQLVALLCGDEDLDPTGESFQQAIALLREIHAGRLPQVAIHLQSVANRMHHEQKRFDAALALYRDALDVWHQVIAESPTNLDFQRRRLRAAERVARVHKAAGRPEDAERAYRLALEICAHGTAQFPDEPFFREAGGHIHWRIGDLIRTAGRIDEVEPEFRAAQEIFSQLARDFPDHDFFRFEEGYSNWQLGWYLKESKRHTEADACFREALTIYDQLWRDKPDERELRLRTGRAYQFLFENLLEQKKHAEAAETAQLMAERFTEDWEQVQKAAQYLERCAALAAGEDELASAAYSKSAQELWAVVVEHSDNPEHFNNLAWQQVKPPDADPAVALEAAALMRRALEQKPNTGYYWNTLGVAYYRAGQWQQAREALNKSCVLMRRRQLAFNTFFLAMASWQLGEHSAARSWFNAGVLWKHTFAADNQELIAIQDEAARLLDEKVELAEGQKFTSVRILEHVVKADPSALWVREERGLLALRANNPDVAVRRFEKALELRRRQFPDNPEQMADGINSLANALRASGDHQRADELFAEAMSLWGRPQTPMKPPLGELTHLDLTPHITQKRMQGTQGAENNLADMPRGVQTFEGVSFRFENGSIQLGSKNVKNKPLRVEGIAVNRKLEKLHFLHSAQWGNGPSQQIARYEVHYADGTLESIPVIQGEDVKDWWWLGHKKPKQLHIAWVGSNAATRRSNQHIQISRSTWVNPHPDKLVAALSYVCADPEDQPAPFCVAITAEAPTESTPREPVAAPRL